MNQMKINLSEPVEAAAIALSKEMGLDWYKIDYNVKMQLREHVLPQVHAAASSIIDQVLKGIVNVKFDFE